MPTTGSISGGSSCCISPGNTVSNSCLRFRTRTSSRRLRSLPSSLAANPFNGLGPLKIESNVRHQLIKCINTEQNVGNLQEEEEEEDDDVCPVECVREFYYDDEFLKILEKSKTTNALVVVDFYRTSCGSCKYIEKGFSKLCKASGDDAVPVIFLKHNVIDEYDERSEVAERLRIKTVPLFHFYKNGTLLEAFATRDKERITEAIYRYMSPGSQLGDGSN